ncbi:DIS3-like exonuclease 2 isoform X2 [Amphibalanus amphitrite]|uniref:DIS3-like exonuclease 2 isoform X2 n=1 Tax=Amphibalanus amphitrite TaxID=1232801 RepID=UPI001C9296F1|nr:DIS3-like exonuclease 2 isoform X2 [Amphibalanus amphitrite]
MSCASYIHVSAAPPARPRPRRSALEDIDDHAALIGLQALTLNLASANRLSEEPEPRKKCLKPLSISTARKTPEKHVSISPQSATPRSAVSSSPRSRPSPSRSESSGFHSLPSPDGLSSCSEGSSGCCGQRGRLFTNHSNMEVKPSDSLESVNTRSSGQSRQNNRPRQGTPQSRQGTPQSRRGTPHSRHGTPQPRHGTPHARHSVQHLRHGTTQRDSLKGFEEYATIFDVQQGLKKGQLVEGVLRINPKSYKDAYISAPDGLTDIYVGGVRDRNRGLHGDVVAVQLRPPNEWRVSENALVTHLVTNGTVSDLETLYGSDEILQKYAPKLDEILPERFPRPLRLGSGHTAGSENDLKKEAPAESDPAPQKAVPDGPVGGDSGEESDDIVVESVTIEPPTEGKAEEVKEEKEAPSAESAGQAGSTEPASVSGDAETAGDQTGPAETDPAEQSAEDGSQKPRRGTRAGRGRRRRQQESVAARLAALSLTSAPDGTSDERRDTQGAASAKRSGSSETNPGPSAVETKEQGAQSAPAEGARDVVHTERVESVDKCTEDADEYVDDCTEDGAGSSEPSSAKKRSRRPLKKKAQHLATAGETAEGGTPGTPGTPRTPGTHHHHLHHHQHHHQHHHHHQHGATPNRHQKNDKQKEKPKDGSALGVTVERALAHPEWGRFVQRTAKVVHIVEPKHPRRAVGELRQFPDGSRHQAMFAPRDHRVPRLKVAAADCPADFFQQPQLYARTLFMAEITEWTEPGFARGRLSQLLGDTGSVDVEMEAILLEHGVDTREFGPQDLPGLPTVPWSIPADEIERRRDFRKECVFTIDPLTARDLDDAVSCRRLESGDYEVGVHIADVSYFLKQGVPADLTAAQRCNSVYLVHKVIPMLPRLLCEDLCSLNPAEDRLAFSVVWKLDTEGRVFDEWFGRTVIRSCTKLAYEHAQRIIENPDNEPGEEDLPPIDGGWSRKDIAERVLVLHKMAQCMRQRRTDDGALRLDQPKLCFQLDGPKGAPTGFYTYNQQDSNRLIEEFMLLANMAVAARILRSYPQLSVLRRHTPPQEGPLADAARLLKGVGLEIDVETSGTVHDSLQAMAAAWQAELPPQEAIARMAVVVNLLSRPMNPAEYFCSGVLTEAAQYRHYALSVPLYTHFTSPIRRYPDVLVHRLLAAALQYEPLEQLPPIIVQRLCVRCNEKKLSARLCSEACSLLFLAHMVDLCGPIRQPAIVMGVLDKSFDVFIPEMAISRRVYIDKLEVESVEFTKQTGVPRLKLTWRATDTEPAVDQIIELFTPVTVSLEATDMPLKFSTVALRPGAAVDGEGAALQPVERRCVPTAELDEA